jgi:hypothetical protein
MTTLGRKLSEFLDRELLFNGFLFLKSEAQVFLNRGKYPISVAKDNCGEAKNHLNSIATLRVLAESILQIGIIVFPGCARAKSCALQRSVARPSRE